MIHGSRRLASDVDFKGNSGVPNLETSSLACSRYVRDTPAEVAFTMDCISVGVDQMQRNFAAMRKQAAD
jgi:hypothetical protein